MALNENSFIITEFVHIWRFINYNEVLVGTSQPDIALALNGFLTSYSPSITKVNIMCTISVGVYNNTTIVRTEIQ